MTDFNTPWTYDKTTGCIIGSDGHSIAYVSGHMRHDGDPDALACGSMIAAAPQMLEALKAIAEWLLDTETIKDNTFWNGQFVKANNLALAAIAAAEGRTTP